MDTLTIYYWISSIFLALLLFRPAKKFILAQRINRAQRKLKRALTDDEKADLERRTIPMTAIIVITFSLLFNNVLMGKHFHFK